ncbi:hypothetical protein LEP3755_11820 [Leptolyngbya sp. NIES-3755]|nr:hypothetical protein LEP3755_11820 [Leptolyngbya sp. NIES-3755]
MTKLLTLKDMKQKYHDEWLLIAYTEVDEDLNVIQGEVLAHSPDVETLYALLPQFKDQAVALEYIGEIPNDLAFVL